MINALGQPQRVLVLGGTSDIALATVRQWAADVPGLAVTLAARDTEARSEAARGLEAIGVRVDVIDFDALDTASHPEVVRRAAEEEIDVAIVAFGVLGDEEVAWQDHDSALLHAQVNYTGAVSVGVLLAQVLRAQGHGVIVALSSVAGERVRRSNFVYGSSKAGMDGFYLGLGEALAGTGVRVTVVRPGHVRTKMTAGREDAPLAVDATEVAAAIVKAVAKGDDLVWVPAPMRAVMSALRHVPRPLFRRLPI
ncbi:MAG: decaprenylphospho-beta-D-erythro-pentofuranosid-2-ulose 2-reductase [Nocardioides sp.]|uniref:decaprenylphospho-beta-D-erythro-pentofuranosid- 2-ulose 2-reductase n=1 Tax=Nocardioides sp. TaxID=35761 RepID=UPI003F050E24